MNIDTQFSIEISSNLDYENMTTNILYQEKTVAILSEEEGLENLKIEILPTFEGMPWCFYLNDFLRILQFAEKQLIQIQKSE